MNHKTFSLAALFFLLTVQVYSAARDRIEIRLLKSISWEKKANVLEVTIRFSEYSSHQVIELVAPNRLVIDFPAIDDIETVRRIELDDPNIKSIRLGMFKHDTARVVFDFVSEPVPHLITSIPEGLRIDIIFENTGSTQPDKPKPDSMDITGEKEAKQKAGEELALSEMAKKIEALETAASRLDEKLDQANEQADDTLNLLQEIRQKKREKAQRFVRIEVTANYYQPDEGDFKRDFGGGLMEGAELNVSVFGSLESWIAIKNYTQASSDASPTRRIRIVPLEIGLKWRFNKKTFNPYLGIGAGHHQYKELRGNFEIKKRKLGIIVQAGCFFKVADNLVLDLSAHYRSCTLDIDGVELNLSGLHFGGGLGFEF